MEATTVNVAEVLSVEENQSYVEKIKEAIEKNPVVTKALEVAETVEEVYGTVKDYIQVKFEDFKVCFEKAMSFYKESKAELSDEVLDNVAGGGFWGNLWNKYKTAIIATAIVVGCIATGGVVGVAAGALMGTVAAGVAGGVIGGAITGGFMAKTYVEIANEK